MNFRLLALFMFMGLGACSTVTIHPESSIVKVSEPTVKDSKHFFLWGMVGEERVDVKRECGEREVVQMQSQQTVKDGALTLVTLIVA